MGKRKSARKPTKRVKEVLAKKFTCIYCSHEDAVTAKIDQTNQVGHINCRACGVSYQTPVHALSEPVDIYSAWIDAAEDAQKQANSKPQQSASTRELPELSDSDGEERVQSRMDKNSNEIGLSARERQLYGGSDSEDDFDDDDEDL
ncbi:hypothetical protein HDU85_002036 [Gaertneriomyces sp. JEL0708]|nr:hypothetical protein HDU85_002036 [Gaertneriomyces sp. JEL0708]